MSVCASIRAGRRAIYRKAIPSHHTLLLCSHSSCLHALRVFSKLDPEFPFLSQLEVVSGKLSHDSLHAAIAMPRNPTSWDQYHYGSSPRGSISSVGDRSVHFDESEGSPPVGSPHGDVPLGEEEVGEGSGLRRRR
jgi:hypothetical protein